VRCSACAAPLMAGARFCTACGRPCDVSTEGASDISPPPAQPVLRPLGADYFATPADTRSAALHDSLQRTLDAVQAAPVGLTLAQAFPVKDWLQDRTWWRGPLGVFVMFATAPFVLLHLSAKDEDLTTATWGFAVYFALVWSLAMYKIIRPERPPTLLIVKLVVFSTLVSTAFAVFIEKRLDPDMTHLLWTIGGVGLPEEIAKAMPVVIFVFLSRRRYSPRLFMFAGAISGLAFGAAEAVTYATFYSSLGDYVSFSDIAAVTVWRLLTDGLFHACFAATAAFFIGVAAWSRDKSGLLIAIGIGTSSVLHGAYDRWAGNWFGLSLAVLIIVLFVAYVRTGDRIALSIESDRRLTGTPTTKEQAA
jgi:RsiW-degrading membrane proteinase PrsW (M82 family)